MLLSPVQAPGSGLAVVNEDAIMLSPATGGVVAGGCYAIDLATVDSYGQFNTLRAVATADFNPTVDVPQVVIFCIALEASSAAGVKVRVRLSGYVDALVDGTQDVTLSAAGATSFLRPSNASPNLVTATTMGGTTTLTRVVALSTVTYTSDSAALKRVLFEGRGLGYGYSVS